MHKRKNFACNYLRIWYACRYSEPEKPQPASMRSDLTPQRTNKAGFGVAHGPHMFALLGILRRYPSFSSQPPSHPYHIPLEVSERISGHCDHLCDVIWTKCLLQDSCWWCCWPFTDWQQAPQSVPTRAARPTSQSLLLALLQSPFQRQLSLQMAIPPLLLAFRRLRHTWLRLLSLLSRFLVIIASLLQFRTRLRTSLELMQDKACRQAA
jgi:hypothetical protein